MSRNQEITTTITSPAGEAWLKTHDELVQAFFDGPAKNGRLENVFASAGGESIGTGQTAVVWAVDGMAVKVNTPINGRHWHVNGEEFSENPHMQAMVMTALDKIFAEDPSLTVPQQHFVISGKQRYLRCEQYMEEWTPISTLAVINRTAPVETRVDTDMLHDTAQARVRRAIGHSLINDRLDLNSSNILVPPLGEQDPELTPFCIIDQPCFKHFRDIVLNKLILPSYLGLSPRVRAS